MARDENIKTVTKDVSSAKPDRMRLIVEILLVVFVAITGKHTHDLSLTNINESGSCYSQRLYVDSHSWVDAPQTLKLSCFIIIQNRLLLQLDLGATLVCQSDPTWYKSDPKSTSSRRFVPKTT